MEMWEMTALFTTDEETADKLFEMMNDAIETWTGIPAEGGMKLAADSAPPDDLADRVLSGAVSREEQAYQDGWRDALADRGDGSEAPGQPDQALQRGNLTKIPGQEAEN